MLPPLDRRAGHPSDVDSLAVEYIAFITGLLSKSQTQTICLRIALAGPFAYAPPVGTLLGLQALVG
jgi:hypothetical protein